MIWAAQERWMPLSRAASKRSWAMNSSSLRTGPGLPRQVGQSRSSGPRSPILRTTRSLPHSGQGHEPGPVAFQTFDPGQGQGAARGQRPALGALSVELERQHEERAGTGLLRGVGCLVGKFLGEEVVGLRLVGTERLQPDDNLTA